ncbi:MAG: lipid A deacylase LpxR family protein, partial [Alphaproteobacteria bacterium]|nr:lipid A deacylase LpxR family protein [Alphaproteobacteria bacterium]
MTFLGRASLAVLMVLCAAGAVRAQSPSDQGSTPVCRTHGQDEKRSEDGCWTFNLQVENDSVFGGADRHYTNGMRLTLVSPESIAYFDFMRETSEKVALTREAYLTRFSYGLGQNMYTPTEIRTTTPDPKDRPYAGWLYLSTGFVTYPADLSRTEGWKIMNAAELEIGVVGPAAKADITQKEWHELVNAPEPKGWSHQLKNEPGLAIYYEAQARSPKKTLVGDFSADIAPSAGVALGNVYDYVGAGATLRFGYSLPDDYGPP